jgi:hypothetical protein
VQKVEDHAQQALLEINQNLAKQDIKTLKAALAQHISDMQRLVPSGRDQIKPKVGVEQLFERFVDVRREKLSDVGVRRRLARRLQLTRLPDFWGDQEAVQEFEETFFSNLALRLRTRGNVPRIARAFRDQLGFGVRGTSALRKALERHLEDKGWELRDWPTPGQAEQEDEELDDC